MMITAHGGALKTGRNTQKYFDTIEAYDVDAIEVDIYKRNNHLYISHLPKLFYKKAITLEWVFEYIKTHNFRINCDVKWRGLVKPVLEIAKKIGVEEKIYFTGFVTREDLKDLDAGEAYLNAGFFKPQKPIVKDLDTIKKTLDSLNNQRVKGININYRYCSDEFLTAAKELNVPLSIFTVDNKADLLRFLSREEIANITTNIVDVALENKAK